MSYNSQCALSLSRFWTLPEWRTEIISNNIKKNILIWKLRVIKYISERAVDLPFDAFAVSARCALCSHSPSPSVYAWLNTYLPWMPLRDWFLGELLLLLRYIFFVFLYRRHSYRSAVQMQLFCLSKYNFQRFFSSVWFCGVKMGTASHWCVVFFHLFVFNAVVILISIWFFVVFFPLITAREYFD